MLVCGAVGRDVPRSCSLTAGMRAGELTLVAWCAVLSAGMLAWWGAEGLAADRKTPSKRRNARKGIICLEWATLPAGSDAHLGFGFELLHYQLVVLLVGMVAPVVASLAVLLEGEWTWVALHVSGCIGLGPATADDTQLLCCQGDTALVNHLLAEIAHFSD